MKRMAVISNTGVVENIALWDGISEWFPEPGCETIDVTLKPEVDIGCLYINGFFYTKIEDN